MYRAAILVLALLLNACGSPAPFTQPEAGPALTIAGGVTRHDVRFACGEVQCAAWLYLPATQTKAPVVVMGHGFGGTRDGGLEPFAEHFARDGLAALVFDYRHFGASGGMPRQLVNPWTQIEDWRAAVAFGRADPRVDGARLAVWGTSLGGGLALITAASDPGIRAAVAQAPLIDSNAEGEATFPGVWWLIRLLFTAWSDLANDALGGAPITIAAVAPSGGFGMIPDDKALASAKAMTKPGSTYRNEVLARSIFTFDDYNPAVQAAALKTPTLLIGVKGDRFAPFAAVEAFAKSHRNAKLTELDGDHFDIYVPPRSDSAAALASEFLRTQLR
jgi:pimeloyl-ACP methyl ester carboxylesterase